MVWAKSDLDNHSVSKDDADQFTQSFGIEHVEVSAKNETNVEYVFTSLVE